MTSNPAHERAWLHERPLAADAIVAFVVVVVASFVRLGKPPGFPEPGCPPEVRRGPLAGCWRPASRRW